MVLMGALVNRFLLLLHSPAGCLVLIFIASFSVASCIFLLIFSQTTPHILSVFVFQCYIITLYFLCYLLLSIGTAVKEVQKFSNVACRTFLSILNG